MDRPSRLQRGASDASVGALRPGRRDKSFDALPMASAEKPPPAVASVLPEPPQETLGSRDHSKGLSPRAGTVYLAAALTRGTDQEAQPPATTTAPPEPATLVKSPTGGSFIRAEVRVAAANSAPNSPMLGRRPRLPEAAATSSPTLPRVAPKQADAEAGSPALPLRVSPRPVRNPLLPNDAALGRSSSPSPEPSPRSMAELTSELSSMAEIETSDALREDFLKYAASKFASENVSFWLEARKVKAATDASTREALLRAIRERFLDAASVDEVNLSAKARNELLRGFRADGSVEVQDVSYLDRAMREVEAQVSGSIWTPFVTLRRGGTAAAGAGAGAAAKATPPAARVAAEGQALPMSPSVRRVSGRPDGAASPAVARAQRTRTDPALPTSVPWSGAAARSTTSSSSNSILNVAAPAASRSHQEVGGLSIALHRSSASSSSAASLSGSPAAASSAPQSSTTSLSSSPATFGAAPVPRSPPPSTAASSASSSWSAFSGGGGLPASETEEDSAEVQEVTVFSVAKTTRPSPFPGFKISTMTRHESKRGGLAVRQSFSGSNAPSCSPTLPDADPLPSEDTLLEVLSPAAAAQIKAVHQGASDRVDLSMLRLGFVPASVAKLGSKVSSLVVAGNNLAELPDLSGLRALQELDLSFNTELAPLLGGLSEHGGGPLPASLMNLIVRHCALSSLSDAMLQQVPQLSGLDLRFNAFCELPSSLFAQRWLCELLASDNELRALQLQPSPLRLIDVCCNRIATLSVSPPPSPSPSLSVQAYALERLLLSRNALCTLPAALSALQGLAVLDVSHNALTELPPALASLRNLRVLRAQGNRITALKFSLESLRELRLLNLAHNFLGMPPVGLDCAVNLQTLSLSCNYDIEDVRIVAWSALSQLKALMLSGTKIKVVPASLASHPGLRVLYLGYNQIEEVPSFMEAVQLTVLFLPGNRIKALPPDFLGVEANVQLQQLSLRGNAAPLAWTAPGFPNLVVDVNQPEPRTLLGAKDVTVAAAAETVGLRPLMEDRSVVAPQLYAVFDGHAGVEVAHFCSQNLGRALAPALQGPAHAVEGALRRAFATLQQDVGSKGLVGGAVAVAALTVGPDLFVANCGDAEALLVESPTSWRCLTERHVVTNPAELARIKEAGGLIVDGKLDGVVEVTRRVGDGALALCIPEPSVCRATVQHDSVLVLGCNGLFDELPYRVVAKLAKRYAANPVLASMFLRDEAFFAGSTDNISCIVVALKARPQAAAAAAAAVDCK